MALPLLIEAELDDRSAAAAMNRAERMVSDSARDMARTFNDQVGGAIRGAGDELDQMADKARTAFRRMGDSAEEVTRQERELEQIRDRSGKGVDDQSDKVRRARREEAAAVREAASAYDDYEQAASGAGDAAQGVASSTQSSLAGLGSSLRGAGGEAATGFAEGFGASGALARLGTAGGPIGIALAAAAALGYKAGETLMDQIDQGMASLQIQDKFQARLGIDPETAARWGNAAGSAYADMFGQSIEDNLATAQTGIQARLIAPGAPDAQMQRYIEQTQALQGVTEENPEDLARGARNLVSTGLVQNYTQAFDLLAAGQQKGLNLSHDLIDTTEEYSTVIQSLGLSGADALGLMNQMMEGGARNIDQAADALKELQINATDPGNVKQAQQAFAALGYDAGEMSRKFAEGGPAARQALGEVLDGINSLEDPIERRQVGLALFKTKWEDLGNAIGKADLKTAADSLGRIDGELKRSSDTMSQNVSQWDKLGRTIDNATTSVQRYLAESDPGKFLTGALPQFINQNIFGDQTDLRAAAQAAIDQQLPPDDFASAGDAQRARRGLPPLSAPGAPGTGRVNPVAMPAPGTPGASTKPSFDPSQYSIDAIPVQGNIPISPMAPGSPGAQLVVDPGKVFDAQSAEMNARQAVEAARVRVLELTASNTATEQDVQAAKNQVQNAERAYLSAEAKLQEAQRGTYEKMQGTAKSFSDGMSDIGAHLDSDLGISKGLPGIADNLVRFLASIATAPLMGQLSAISAANPNQGSGLVGILASQGAFGAQYTPAAIAAASGAPGGATSGYSASAPGGAALPGESARAYAHRVKEPFFESEGLTVGDHAADKYGEHQNGALDIMVPSIAKGNDVLKQVLSDPDVYGAIFNNQTYGYGHGTTPQDYSAGHTGDPSQDHTNHVHAFYKPGGDNNITPLQGGYGQSSGPVPVNVVNGPSALMNGGGGLSPQQWDKIAGAEASGNWAANTGNGFSGGLQFAPGSWNEYGGQQYAPQAWQATPQQQMAIGDNLLAGQGPDAWPATSAAHPDWFQPGAGGLPAIPAGAGGGQGYTGLGGPRGAGAPGGGAPGMGTGVAFPGAPGGGGAGIGVGGGLLDAAAGAAGMLDMVMPGAGSLAQMGIKAVNRTIQFAGQAAAIDASGLMETFLPAGSDRAAHGWLPRIVGGLAGAKPALPNTAGGQAPQQQPGGAGGQGGAVDQSTNITNNVATPQGSTPDQQAKALEFHQQAAAKPPGP